MTQSIKTRTTLYFVAILLGSWSADAAEVSLRPQSQAQGSLVLLGDVAEVKSTDQELATSLKRIELFPAPAQQRSRLMHVRELIELLVLHGVNLQDIEFTGAKTARIYSPSQDAKVAPAGMLAPVVESNEMVAVARRALNRGDIIHESDIEMQSIEPQALRSQLVTDRRAAVGMEVVQPLREGQTIMVYQIRKPLLVKRGEVIRVRARAAGVQVTTTARASDDGAIGDIIMVQSLENREKYPTHVTGLREVEVYATGVVAGEPSREIARRKEFVLENK